MKDQVSAFKELAMRGGSAKKPSCVTENRLSGGDCAGENGEEMCYPLSGSEGSTDWKRAPRPFREGFSLRPAVTL